jgi:trigger factor
VEVTLKELPEINDDFVRDLNIEDITSLKELREIERNRLIDEQNQRIRQNLQNQLFLKLDELITFDQVPPNLLESQIDREIVHIRDMAMYHNQRELKESVEQWLNNQELRDKYRQQAIFNIKIQAIKFKLLKAENITVEDSEVADYVKRLSEYAQYDQADDLNSKQFTLQIAERLRNDKLIDVLLSKVQFKEFTPEKPESIPGQPESTPEQPKSPDGETKGETTDETLGETKGESSDNPS